MSPFSPWPQSWTKETEITLLDADLLHCGGYLHYPAMFFGKTTELFCHAKDQGIVTSIDTQFPLVPGKTKSPWLLNMTDILPFVDVLIMDEHEARSFAGTEEIDAAVHSIQQYKTKVIIIKFGELGSRVYTLGMVLEQPAFTIAEPVDSIGAGDAYGSAFMTYYIHNRSIEECARFASIVASFTVTKAGGILGFPTTIEAENFIDQHNIPLSEKQEWPIK
jgi:sugar/nucleoside kinase (ribokinase family)